jgi:hypothetical protein
MWSTLALMTALSLAPHQAAGQLKLANVRATYGVLGATRTDNKLLPGDAYFITYDIENLTVGDDGLVLYGMGMELLNSRGKAEYSKEPQDLTARNALGGNRLPGFAQAEIGTDTAPGEYTLNVTVIDRKSKQKATLTRKFEVLPKDFGLVRASLTYYNPTPLPAPPLAVAGQAFLFNSLIVGFARAGKDKDKDEHPDVGVELVILDEQGNPTVKKPIADEAGKDVPKTALAIPVQVPLELNRPGKFTVKLTATDRLTKKTATVSMPIQVVELSESK